MSPIAITQTQTETLPNIQSLKLKAQADPGKSRLSAPLKYQGSLDKYEHFDVTPSIGREFKDLQLSDLLHAEDNEVLMRELGVLVSRRGCCIFRDQNISGEDMLELASRISKATGSPEASDMCIHPISANWSELGEKGKPKTQTISADLQRKGGGISRLFHDVSRWNHQASHSDVSFETCPADYSMLKIFHMPSEGSGGDTMFWDCAGVLEKISPSFLAYLETLEVEHNANFFHEEAAHHGREISDTLERGNPLNKGKDLRAVHPMIRTNPVTGYKSLFYNRGFSGRILGVTKDENDMIRSYLDNILCQNWDCQLRARWEKNTIALWDNRSTHHSATFDYVSERKGDRASSLGERPYYDASSKYKWEALKEEASAA